MLCLKALSSLVPLPLSNRESFNLLSTIKDHLRLRFQLRIEAVT